MLMLGRNSFWGLLWDFDEFTYATLGFSPCEPIRWIWPGFLPWLFAKVIGCKKYKQVKQGGGA